MSLYPEIEFQLVDFPSPPSPGPDEISNGKRKWRRNHAACDACHARRVKCDMESPLPCSRCQRKDIHCDITRQRRKRGRIPRSKKAHPHEALEAPRWHVREKHTDGSSPISLPDLPKVSTPETPSSYLSEMKDVPDGTIEGDVFAVDASELEFDFGTNAADDWLSMAHLAHDWPLPALTESSGSIDMSPSIPDSESSPIPSSPTSCQQDQGEKTLLSSLRYPVLHSVMPFLEMQLSPRLACDLLELYFAVESPLHTHPACQNIQCHILRKASFTDENFRPTSMALLTSMLWIAASDDQVFSLSILPSQQRRICQFLGDLTKTLLSFSDSFLSVQMWNSGNRNRSDIRNDLFNDFDGGKDLKKSIGHLDDLLTCIHVASILTTEQNTTCKEWCEAAFSLARKLELNDEIPVAPEDDNTEEHREERRRTWWLLYIMDRHLALCHNRPLALLDEECKNLHLPMDEISWQNGAFHRHGNYWQEPMHIQSKRQNKGQKLTRQTFQGSSLFEFLLPLLKITGDIINLSNLHSLENKACETEADILAHLESYQISLATFMSSSASQSLNSEALGQFTNKETFQHCPTETQLPIAYSSYLVHVLHILLIGNWNWPHLIESKDFFTSPTFTSTKSHILEAAFWLQQILHLDPETRFMSYFFGTQLLQGSFPVLLIIEKLQRDSGEEILLACETMIRAIESCLVTQDEYVLRVVRRLLHGAVSQAWGRPLSEREVRCRRKAISMLFLWVRRGSSGRDTSWNQRRLE